MEFNVSLEAWDRNQYTVLTSTQGKNMFKECLWKGSMLQYQNGCMSVETKVITYIGQLQAISPIMYYMINTFVMSMAERPNQWSIAPFIYFVSHQ